FRSVVKCVVLNACYSKVQADALRRHIDYTIGMTDKIGNEAAIKFSEGFYDAIGAERPIEDAYRLGCNSIELAGLKEEHIPVLYRGQTLGTSALTQSSDIPEIESFLQNWFNTPIDLRYKLTTEGEALKNQIISAGAESLPQHINHVAVRSKIDYPTHIE